MLSDDKYLRERIAPKHGDTYYLHLSDLLLALKELLPKDAASMRVLDFGCGGSPYRQFFSSDYVRADIEFNPDRDVVLDENFCLPADIGQFDLVLSTQVLEHVEDPRGYLTECHRVLPPGGALLLTTHGLFEDHGCPYDYWRWTADGLRKLLQQSGFEAERLLKITCGPRHAIFGLEREMKRLAPKRGMSAFHMLFRAMKALGPAALHAFADKAFPHLRVVEAVEASSPRCVALGVLSRRQ